MAKIPGVETIINTGKKAPRGLKLPYSLLHTQTQLQGIWNNGYIAVVLYCVGCKRPIDWYSPPERDKLFSCPRCHRSWTKGSGWDNAK